MPDALTLSLELAAIALAAALVARAIFTLESRPLLAGGALAVMAWMIAGWMGQTPKPYERLQAVSLRLRPVDAATGDMIGSASVAAFAPNAAGEHAAWRLPTSIDAADKSVMNVSVFFQQEVGGSAWEQFWRAAQCIRAVDQQLEISAPGYRPWRGGLNELLSAAADKQPLVIELRRNS